MLNDNANKKIMQILKKMDQVMSTNGFNQYQERIHRIYKNISSIQLHTDCEVSQFISDLQEEKKEMSCIDFNKEEYASEYLTVQGANEIEVDSECGSPYKIKLDELLRFIENELTIHNFLKDSGSSSDDEETNDSSKSKEKSRSVSKKEGSLITKRKMQKKFFKIELKLRSYIEEQEAIRKNFDSILNGSKGNTPISKLTKNPLPSLINNFFADKESIQKQLDKANQRYSMRDFNIRAKLETLSNMLPRKKGSISVIPISKLNKGQSTVRDFDAECLDDMTKNEIKREQLNLSMKKNSIFDIPNLNIVEEENLHTEGSEFTEESDLEEEEESEFSQNDSNESDEEEEEEM